MSVDSTTPVNHTFLTGFVLLGFPVSNEPLLFLTFLMIYLLSLACNFLIIRTVCQDPRLHSPMYFFICSFSFLEICYTSVTMPRLLRDLLSQDKIIKVSYCVSQFYFLFAFGSTENFLLSAMAYDRYVAICNPLRYMNIVTHKVMSYALVIATVSKIPSPSGRRKTLSTCGSHFMVVCMFYGSIIFMYVRSDVRIPTKIDKVVSLFYCVVTPTLNPMIYALRNKNMKEALRRNGKMLFLRLN
ncbi:olfactory receptor 6B1-like [Pelobates fuscus]|uniref:olfactory receptor 6B1-like n=1 Tax=Pelobates fuscus TaxID=191477 RepID=UPI002FE4A0A8